jgi:CxxC-x17-CxxC domain-containing protein
MGRAGQAITLLGPEDAAKWRQLERGLAHRIPRGRWPGAQAAIDGTAEAMGSASPAERREVSPPRSQPRVERPESPPVQRRHQVICHECGEQAQVPFSPDPSRPVYCGACFQAEKHRRQRRTPRQ